MICHHFIGWIGMRHVNLIQGLLQSSNTTHNQLTMNEYIGHNNDHDGLGFGSRASLIFLNHTWYIKFILNILSYWALQ